MKRFIKFWFYLLFLPFMVGIIYIGTQHILLEGSLLKDVIVAFIMVFALSQLGLFISSMMRKTWWRSVEDYEKAREKIEYTEEKFELARREYQELHFKLLIINNIKLQSYGLPNAKVFRDYRENTKLNIKEVSEEANVPASTISRVESNKTVEYNNIAILYNFYLLKNAVKKE